MRLILLFALVSSTHGLNCTGNFTYGYTTNIQTIPATLSQFISIVGNFYNTTWYQFIVNSTTGPNNQINSTRLITNSNGSLVTYETLIGYQTSNTYFEMSWTGPGDKLGTVDFGSFLLSTYIESLSGTSTCGGSAVYIDYETQFCASNFTTAANVLTQRHFTDIQNIKTFLGIGNATACRSSRNLNKSNSLFIGIFIIFIIINIE
jgi:hypothetical protein